ncbi:hypothetical protein [Paucibacter soli]|uniref:hypothetical protein n=1 Tax=Paucibacter soli TaxID=3133433 RepID=UPI0030A09A22
MNKIAGPLTPRLVCKPSISHPHLPVNGGSAGFVHLNQAEIKEATPIASHTEPRSRAMNGFRQ